jgi:hypothetical protein
MNNHCYLSTHAWLFTGTFPSRLVHRSLHTLSPPHPPNKNKFSMGGCQGANLPIGRAFAVESAHIGVGDIVVVHRVNCGIKAHDGRDTGAQKEDSVPEVPEKLPLVSSNPSLNAVVLALDSSSGWVKCFIRKNGVTLGFEADHQDWWKGVRELQDTQGRDECREQGDLRNSGSDNEGENPIAWHKGNPYPLASLRLETREFEEVGSNVVVNDFNAYVAVKTCSNDAGNQFENVPDRLPVVRVDALVRRIINVLALQSVADGAIDEISEIDEDFAT